jgi:hypothetical protein
MTTLGGGTKSQALHNNQDSLWNTAVARRAFLKRSGFVGVASLAGVAGLRVDSLACVESGWHRVLSSETFKSNAPDKEFASFGNNVNAVEASNDAMSDLYSKIEAWMNQGNPPNGQRVSYKDVEVPVGVAEGSGGAKCQWAKSRIQFTFDPPVSVPGGGTMVKVTALVHQGDTWDVKYDYPDPTQCPETHQG